MISLPVTDTVGLAKKINALFLPRKSGLVFWTRSLLHFNELKGMLKKHNFLMDYV
jgi:hypothetical protein